MYYLTIKKLNLALTFIRAGITGASKALRGNLKAKRSARKTSLADRLFAALKVAVAPLTGRQWAKAAGDPTLADKISKYYAKKFEGDGAIIVRRSRGKASLYSAA